MDGSGFGLSADGARYYQRRMIRLRKALDRGLRHRWLGPVCLILFVLLMALMFMHTAHDNEHSFTDIGEICLALTVMFAFIVIIRLGWPAVQRLVPVTVGRGPPVTARPITLAASPVAAPVRLRL